MSGSINFDFYWNSNDEAAKLVFMNGTVQKKKTPLFNVIVIKIENKG